MKLLFKFSLAITPLLIAVIFACTRQKPDYIGPAYVSVPDGFTVNSFSPSVTSISFNPTASMTFDATFSSSVSWTLTLKGVTSGAVHTVQGISSGFTGLQWFGNHDDAIFFKTGEKVMATLSFFATSLTSQITTPISIIQAPDYTGCGTFAQYGSFEDSTKIHHTFNWHAFNDPIAIPNVKQGVESDTIDFNGDTVRAAEGKMYYYIKGKGNQPVFVSGLQYNGPLTPVLSSNADDVWVNMLIYGTGDENAGVELEYQEDDPGRGAPGYQGTTDDAFVARITLSHKGWKMFSFRYSDLTPSLNADFGGSGNHVHEPNRLVSFDLVLVKKTDGNKAIEVFFDYPIITVGGPFKPCH
jgi:hypothetical protein